MKLKEFLLACCTGILGVMAILAAGTWLAESALTIKKTIGISILGMIGYVSILASGWLIELGIDKKRREE